MQADAATMQVIVNGAASTTAARTLAALLSERGFEGQPVATALNGDFVPASRRGAVTLKAGDRIEIVSPRQGG